MINLQDKIKSKTDNELTPDDIPEIHDILMAEYGWIPLAEFRKLPISTMFSLLLAIKERREKEQKEAEKARKR